MLTKNMKFLAKIDMGNFVIDKIFHFHKQKYFLDTHFFIFMATLNLKYTCFHLIMYINLVSPNFIDVCY